MSKKTKINISISLKLIPIIAALFNLVFNGNFLV